MPNDPNKVLQKSDTVAHLRQNGPIFLAQDAARDAVRAHPDMTSVELSDLLLHESDPQMLRDLAETLVRKFFRHEIQAQRRKEIITSRRQNLLPGFEHLPTKIETRDGTRIRLMGATFRRLRDYYRILMKRARSREDPKIKEIKRLMEKMREASRDDQGVTVKRMLEQGY